MRNSVASFQPALAIKAIALLSNRPQGREHPGPVALSFRSIPK